METPTKISPDLEPNIFTDYDASKLDEINASYNINTKEIVWFYTPKSAAEAGVYPTYGIVYNTASGNFFRRRYPAKVDWAAHLQVDGSDGWTGHRQIIGERYSAGSTTQRAYFHDQLCRSGDIFPRVDFAVKQISTPSAGVKRLTLAAGFDATLLGSASVGDYVALQGISNYIGTTTDTDMLAKISAINTGAGTIDFLLPTGAVLADATLTRAQYFQAYLAQTDAALPNGISYQVKTNYWVVSQFFEAFFFLWVWMLSKLKKWPTDIDVGPTISYRTPTAVGNISDDLTLQDTSDGNWQIYHELRTGDDNHEGQAIRITLSGIHLAHEWVLQYLEVHGTPLEQDNLRRFEA